MIVLPWHCVSGGHEELTEAEMEDLEVNRIMEQMDKDELWYITSFTDLAITLSKPKYTVFQINYFIVLF